MAVLAKGLPVLFIPEKHMIAAMGNDMVNHCCRSKPALPLAFTAERVSF